MAKEKAKHDGLLCFLLALIVVLILVIGGGAYYFLVVDNEEETAKNEIQKDINTSREINKIDVDKEIVYTIEDTSYNKETMESYNSKIPCINLNYDSAKLVNNKIQKTFEEEKGVYAYTYSYAIYSNIISIKITKEDYIGVAPIFYDTYNIDMYTGDELSNDEVLKIKNMEKEYFRKQLNTKVAEFYDDFKKQITNEQFYEELNKGYNKVKNNIDSEKGIQLFINNEGDLNAILELELAGLAGAGFQNRSFVIKNLKEDILVKEDTKSNQTENKYSEITKELDGIDVLYVTNAIKNTNNTYTLKGVIYTRYTLTDNELKQIINKGEMKINNLTYSIKNSNNNNGEYGLYDSNNYELYTIKQLDKSLYYLETNASLINQWKKTEDYRQITVANDIKYMGGEGEILTVNDIFKDYKDVEPEESTCPSNEYTFNFVFENGKCVAVRDAITSQ